MYVIDKCNINLGAPLLCLSRDLDVVCIVYRIIINITIVVDSFNL